MHGTMPGRLPCEPSEIAPRTRLPSAICSRKLTGVHVPTIPELYEPVLAELATMGVSFVESVETL